MQARWTEIGGVLGFADQLAQALELRPADVGQRLAFGPQRGARIEVDGHLEALRDMLAEAARERDTLVHRRLAQRNEGDHVDGANARVLAFMAAHVDLRNRLGHGQLHRPRDGRFLPGKGQHAPIVIAVGRPIEQVDAGNPLDLAGDRVNDLEPPAFAEVGHAFDQAGHRGQCTDASLFRESEVQVGRDLADVESRT